MLRRTPNTQKALEEARERHGTTCFLCAARPIHYFQNWCIVENEYPYDLSAKTHHMLIPFRHVKTWRELEAVWYWELFDILSSCIYERIQYDCVLWNLPRAQSKKDHFHIHLIEWRK